jgi:5-methylcytosine-specific restriction endonuclease McrA
VKPSIVKAKSDEEFIRLFSRSHNEREFAYSLGIRNLGGATYFALKKRCEDLRLDRAKQWAGAKKAPGTPFYQSDEVYFAENTAHTGADTRTRIRREGLLPYRCSICGNSGRWNEQELTLEIDHINGDHFDNRLANLRFLCPNCHSQTQTYGGKNARTRPLRKEPPKNVSFVFANAPGSPREEKFLFCRRCGKPITRWSKRGPLPRMRRLFCPEGQTARPREGTHRCLPSWFDVVWTKIRSERLDHP